MLTLHSRPQDPFRKRELRRQLDWFLGSDPFFEALTNRAIGAPRFSAERSELGLELRAELPGVRREDLQVRVEDGVLHVRAERPATPPEGYRALRTERVVGTFERAFRLGDELDPEQVEAKLTHGVLTLRLPLRPERRARAIEVQVS